MRTNREIEILPGHRTGLMAEVVTGRLDVRGAAARVRDEFNDLDAAPAELEA